MQTPIPDREQRLQEGKQRVPSSSAIKSLVIVGFAVPSLMTYRNRYWTKLLKRQLKDGEEVTGHQEKNTERKER